MNYKAVLFDLDGTLVDSAPDLAIAINQCLHDLGMPPLPTEQVASYMGKGLERLIIRSLTQDMDATTADPDLYAKARVLCKQHMQALNNVNTKVFPTVIESLQTLKEAGVLLAVVTNKAMEFTMPLLQAKGLDGFFDVVVAGDTCPQKKPDPMPLQYALQQLKVNPQDAAFVGDSANDAQAAKATGVVSYILPYGYTEGLKIEELGGDFLIKDVADFVSKVMSS